MALICLLGCGSDAKQALRQEVPLGDGAKNIQLKINGNEDLENIVCKIGSTIELRGSAEPKLGTLFVQGREPFEGTTFACQLIPEGKFADESVANAIFTTKVDNSGERAELMADLPAPRVAGNYNMEIHLLLPVEGESTPERKSMIPQNVFRTKIRIE